RALCVVHAAKPAKTSIGGIRRCLQEHRVLTLYKKASACRLISCGQPMFERSVFLLVEDNDNDVFFVRRAFSKANVPNPLVVLKNCQDAMAYFLGIGPYANRSEYPLPSLVLLDLHLPGMSGIEFLKWLRQQSAFGQTRVVVLTSSEALRDLNDAY